MTCDAIGSTSVIWPIQSISSHCFPFQLPWNLCRLDPLHIPGAYSGGTLRRWTALHGWTGRSQGGSWVDRITQSKESSSSCSRLVRGATYSNRDIPYSWWELNLSVRSRSHIRYKANCQPYLDKFFERPYIERSAGAGKTPQSLTMLPGSSNLTHRSPPSAPPVSNNDYGHKEGQWERRGSYPGAGRGNPNSYRTHHSSAPASHVGHHARSEDRRHPYIDNGRCDDHLKACSSRNGCHFRR